MKRFKLIAGDERVLNIMCNDGWEIVNTFPNPYPQPYFFALLKLEGQTRVGDHLCNPEDYDAQNVEDHVYRDAEIKQWKTNVLNAIQR
jgi:hypothetical protein